MATGVSARSPEVIDSSNKTASKKKIKKSKAQSGSSVKFLPGSEETKSQRSARLARECKGQVNAGACAGYTR